MLENTKVLTSSALFNLSEDSIVILYYDNMDKLISMSIGKKQSFTKLNIKELGVLKKILNDVTPEIKMVK